MSSSDFGLMTMMKMSLIEQVWIVFCLKNYDRCKLAMKKIDRTSKFVSVKLGQGELSIFCLTAVFHYGADAC